jgi:hypothetical protein
MQTTRGTQTTRSVTSNECNNCGSFVTPQFARVFGDNDDEVYGCLNCQTARELREQAHVSPQY